MSVIRHAVCLTHNTHVVQGMSDDAPTVDHFRQRYVEPMGEESDHVHIVAITDALQVSNCSLTTVSMAVPHGIFAGCADPPVNLILQGRSLPATLRGRGVATTFCSQAVPSALVHSSIPHMVCRCPSGWCTWTRA